MDEDHFLHLTEVGNEIAGKIYERHRFFTDRLIRPALIPKLQRQMPAVSSM